MKCNNEFPYLDEEDKKCYEKCEQNSKNKITIINKSIFINNDPQDSIDESGNKNECENISNNICSECENEPEYKNKEGKCVPIPEECLVVATPEEEEGSNCKICNSGYYPLKEDLNKENLDCYKNLEDIIKAKNKSNYYLNETEEYWDKCYESCEICYAYGSENKQQI